MDAEVRERIDALTTRVTALEGWMEDFNLKWADTVSEIQANTRLTEDIHGRSDEMYEFLLPAVNFFKLLGAIGTGCIRVGRFIVAVVEFLGQLAKPIFWIAAISAAMWAWWKTGSWSMPDWWAKFL